MRGFVMSLSTLSPEGDMGFWEDPEEALGEYLAIVKQLLELRHTQ
jgi:hypothetical protein